MQTITKLFVCAQASTASDNRAHTENLLGLPEIPRFVHETCLFKGMIAAAKHVF